MKAKSYFSILFLILNFPKNVLKITKDDKLWTNVLTSLGLSRKPLDVHPIFQEKARKLLPKIHVCVYTPQKPKQRRKIVNE